jgi:pimeloyl-ACP methyl ester carboxylesterase
MTNATLETLRLRGGRRLGYIEYGDIRGAPIVFCHGSPGAHVESMSDALGPAAAELGVRIIVPDRPGMGGSDPQRGRRILDWPEDVLELANALSLDRFAVLGSSGGTPFALACGARLPDRIRAVGLIGGVGPLSVPELLASLSRQSRLPFQLAAKSPLLARLFYRVLLRSLANDPDKVIARMIAALPTSERALFDRWQFRDGFVRALREAFRQGTRHPVADMRLVVRPWGFDLSDVRVPVLVWHGTQDASVAELHADYLATNLPNCRLSFYPGESHMSVLVHRHRDIFTALAATKMFDATAREATSRDVA